MPTSGVRIKGIMYRPCKQRDAPGPGVRGVPALNYAAGMRHLRSNTAGQGRPGRLSGLAAQGSGARKAPNGATHSAALDQAQPARDGGRSDAPASVFPLLLKNGAATFFLPAQPA